MSRGVAHVRRRRVVGVMGSGTEAQPERSRPLGRLLAERGYDLLTGGGGGVMRAVAEAFCQVENRRGISMAVLPGEVDMLGHRPRTGYPNPFVELVVHTHLPHSGEQGRSPLSRNHINVLSSEALLVLPGAAGTRSEAELAERYGRPTLLFGPEASFRDFPASLERTAALVRVSDFLFEVLGH